VKALVKHPMDWKVVLVTFTTVFLAELGDKTQLTTLSMSATTGAPWSVFVGSALALILASFLGVLAGGIISKYIPPNYIQIAAAGGFLIIGSVMLWQVMNAA
jgi:Ca2+/H+ antiporter, TMEM165/GDT1 family